MRIRRHDSANRRRCKSTAVFDRLGACYECATATHWAAMPLTGTSLDATWSAALTFTKIRNKVHGREMHQSWRGKQWYFRMGADPGLVHTVRGTAANVGELVEASSLLCRKEIDAHGNAGCQVADQRADSCPWAWSAIKVSGLACDPKRSQSCPVPAATRRWRHRALRRQSCVPVPRGQCLSVPAAK